MWGMGPFLRALLTAAVPPQLVKNNSDERIAVKIRVDNKPTLPTGACFVVRPKRQREMQGFQVKRTFHGGQFADPDGAAAARAITTRLYNVAQWQNP